jgi:preprotein translocase subunit SecD
MFRRIRIFGTDTHIRQGLDLKGGMQVLLEADVPANQSVSSDSMDVVRRIIDDRVNALGVSEPIVQISLPRRIVVELPGYDNPDEALKLIQNTGLLEFVETQNPIEPGTIIETDYFNVPSAEAGVSTLTPFLEPTATVSGSTSSGTRYHTIMAGDKLVSARVGSNSANEITVDFVLTSEGARIFAEYTTNHVGWYLAIVLDKNVISCPVVHEPILGGTGSISGGFSVSEANSLAIQLSYGALPIPLKVVSHSSIGPTLGQESLRLSLIAGGIGLTAIILFMLLYYRLPGAIADLALIMYALTSLTVYRVIPVTFTLPGIAGFILSVGMAVDANILIFERMKEELRAGRRLREAVDMGFARAWTSIRDSNISTLITCAILVWFGSSFGANIVKGFAITLAAGVIVSMFTAIVVTRSLLHLVLDRIDFSTRHSWFGIFDVTPGSPEKAQ